MNDRTDRAIPDREWDDFSEATVELDGRAYDVRVYDQPAPGRIPAGATLTGRPLYVAVAPSGRS